MVAWILDEHVVALSLVDVKELSLVMLLRFVTFVTEPKYSYILVTQHADPLQWDASFLW